MQRDAIISDCGTYRYRLSRRWADGPTCLFIMLNPSTADAFEDDRTVGRCIKFAKRERCGSLDVVNLMAFRATDPKDLPDDLDTARGPENLRYVCRAAGAASGPIIAAWGAHPKANLASPQVSLLITLMGRQMYTLNLTKNGAPGHPLYIGNDAPLTPLFGATS